MNRRTLHDYVYFAGLCLLVMSLPNSRWMMSVSQIILGVNWLLEGGYQEKLKRFINNRAAWYFSGIFFIHVIGLLWSSDLEHAILDDLKDKLPTLTLTFLIVSSKPLSSKRIFVLLWLFSITVIITSIIGLIVYHHSGLLDPRKAMPFVSHVYFSMMVVFVAVLLPWLTHRATNNLWYLMLSYLAVSWLVTYIFILSAVTGILCLAAVIAFLIIRELLYNRHAVVRLTAAALLLFAIAGSMALLVSMHENVNMIIPHEPNAMNEKTSLGNPYVHYTNNQLRENGHLVYYFIAEEELRDAWNERSSLEYEGQDKTGQVLKSTLFRYMASLGLKKDREGISVLNDDDIKAIERGVPNHLYTQWPTTFVRIHQTLWEIHQYRTTGNPSGYTFAQRLELWKGSYVAFKKKPLFGWGTGDIFIAVDYGLDQINSKMENYRMKPHNQYILFLLTLGVVGSLAMYGLYYLYIKKTKAYKHLPFNVFLVILLVSMIGNNPIDAQTGQTFFCFATLFFGVMLNQNSPDDQ